MKQSLLLCSHWSHSYLQLSGASDEVRIHIVAVHFAASHWGAIVLDTITCTMHTYEPYNSFQYRYEMNEHVQKLALVTSTSWTVDRILHPLQNSSDVTSCGILAIFVADTFIKTGLS